MHALPAGLSTNDFYYILPEIVLTGGALIVLIADVLLPRGSSTSATSTTSAPAVSTNSGRM